MAGQKESLILSLSLIRHEDDPWCCNVGAGVTQPHRVLEWIEGLLSVHVSYTLFTWIKTDLGKEESCAPAQVA